MQHSFDNEEKRSLNETKIFIQYILSSKRMFDWICNNNTDYKHPRYTGENFSNINKKDFPKIGLFIIIYTMQHRY